MIIAWNTSGLNKGAKIKEVSSRLHNLRPEIVILCETRVKNSNADRGRSILSGRWAYLDNYSNHNNGRLWILWEPNKVQIQKIRATEQIIHCHTTHVGGKISWLIAIYASNKLEKRKALWKDLANWKQQHIPW